MNIFQIILVLVVVVVSTLMFGTGAQTTSTTVAHLVSTIPPAAAAGATVCNKRCDFGWLNFGDKCIKQYNIAKSFAQAYNICRDDYQASVLTLTSLEQQKDAERLFIDSLGGTTGAVRWLWLGAVRCPHSGQFFWLGVNGTQRPISYSNWEVNQPDSMYGRNAEACTAFQLSSQWTYGKWHDIICDHVTGFICERHL